MGKEKEKTLVYSGLINRMLQTEEKYFMSRQINRAEARKEKAEQLRIQKLGKRREKSLELVRRQKGDGKSILTQAMNAVSRISQACV